MPLTCVRADRPSIKCQLLSSTHVGGCGRARPLNLGVRSMSLVLIAALFSPLAAAVFVAAAALVALRGKSPRRSVGKLLISVLVSSCAGALISLAAVIVWMSWYERTTGYSAGNAPAGWIIFYGPISMALGEVVALIWWWSRPIPEPPHEIRA